MSKLVKKPVVIEAVQLRWTQWGDVCELLGSIISEKNPGRSVETYSDTCGEDGPYIELTIPTAEGEMIARHGDWIIRGVKGEFYACKPDIFEATYELAERQVDDFLAATPTTHRRPRRWWTSGWTRSSRAA